MIVINQCVKVKKKQYCSIYCLGVKSHVVTSMIYFVLIRERLLGTGTERYGTIELLKIPLIVYYHTLYQ